MSGISVKIEGLDELVGKLNKMGRMDDVKAVVKMNGAELQSGAQRRAPVDTGTLKRSINLNMKDGGLTAEVEAKAEYAPYVEYGTRYMDAQPFMRPALNAQKTQFVSDLKRLLGGD